MSPNQAAGTADGEWQKRIPGASLARLCIAACADTSLVVAMDGVIIHSNVAIFCPMLLWCL
jgi:hypothetical protein